MYIKKVTFKCSTTTSYIGIGGIKFFDDENLLIDSGKAIKSDTTTVNESEFFRLTASHAAYNADGCIYSAFDSTRPSNSNGTTSKAFYLTRASKNVELTCEFKEPVFITKIEMKGYASGSYACNQPVVITATTIEDNEIVYTSDKLTQTNLASDITPTPKFSFEKLYMIDTVGTIETNDESQVKIPHSIVKIDMKYDVPKNTDMRIALSFDGRQSYKAFRNDTWIDVTRENLITEGNTPQEIQALTEDKFALIVEEDSTLNTLIGLITSDPYVSPKISWTKVQSY